MPGSRKIDPFLLAVVDDKKGIFSIEGPMVDDRPWNKAVCEAQEAKRPVRCMTVGPNAATAEANLVRSFGWKRVSSGSIVSAY